jgi:hypothetical protein
LQVEDLEQQHQIDEVSAEENSSQVQLQQASEITMIADAVYTESQINIDVRGSNENEEINYELIPKLVEGLSYDVMGDEILNSEFAFHFDYSSAPHGPFKQTQSMAVRLL